MLRATTIREALELAILDYNTWAETKAKYIDPVRAYCDLRGIFYNKLKARLGEVGGWRDRIGNWRGSRSLYPDDIKLEINQMRCITWMEITATVSHYQERTSTLQELNTACKGLVIKRISSFEYDVSSIIQQIKDFKS